MYSMLELWLNCSGNSIDKSQKRLKLTQSINRDVGEESESPNTTASAQLKQQQNKTALILVENANHQQLLHEKL